MIEELSVKNFALIDSLTLSLDSGFTVLSGETGAGKSIIVGSLSFLLGSKAGTEVIRSGCDEAGVSALVSIDVRNTDALEWLKSRDISTDDSVIAVRRNVKSSGRGSIYIQNVPVTRNDLAEFMALLFDLHGQHTHETLLRKETHRAYLDRFAGLEEDAAAFGRVFTALAERRKKLESFFSSEKEREERLEILRYAVEEITKADPQKGEIKELEDETRRLGDFEKLSVHVNTAAAAVYDDEPSLLSLGRRARAALENAASIDPSLEPVLKRIDDLFYEAEDLAGEFRAYCGGLTFDPERLEEAEERLSLLYKLKKKYRNAKPAEAAGVSAGKNHSLYEEAPPDDAPLFDDASSYDEGGILAYRTRALAEIESLSGAGESQETLKAEISDLERELAAKAQSLSAKRNEAARRLSGGITGILSKLGMPHAVFSARVSQKGGAQEKDSNESGGQAEKSRLVCGPWGADDVEFLISANAGEPLKELARIASGGELSRVMLAIKTILCGKRENSSSSDAETLVFDEVDTGIGGEVALSVGEYLSQIGNGKQIFCVTHLASIAVRADNHLKVEKKVVSGGKESGGGTERTVTGVTLLDAAERRQEIARMLAGESGSAALAHADELLAKYSGGVVL